MQQKEREQQSKKLREQGGRAETLSSSEGFSWQPAEKRAGMQKKRQNYYIKHKTAAKFAGAARSTGAGTDLTATSIGARFSSAGVQTKRACWKQTACPNTRSAMRGFGGLSKKENGTAVG